MGDFTLFMEPIPLEYKPAIWKKLDEAYPSWKVMKQRNRKKQWIEVDKIIGTDAHNDKWFSNRFFNAIKLIEDEEYDYNHDWLPILFKINGEYFVASDGNHRCLAFKYLKIKKMTAEVVELY